MNSEKILLVRSSWQQVLPIQETAAKLFYDRLFDLDPALCGMFKGDMVEQGRKLMVMINMAVNGLDNLAPLLEPIQNLGKRHVDYGVTAAHYDTVGSALLWTLGQGLGAQFTAEVKDAWTEAYTTLSSAMKQAAYG